MKIIVMGAGIIGVTTAYFLAREGHQVIVLDKNSTSGLGCSYANGGQLSYSHIEPLASKSNLALISKALLKSNSFLTISNYLNKDFLKWSYNFVKNCSQKKSLDNSKKLFRLGKASRAAMHDILRSEENVFFDYNNSGILHFYRTQKSFFKAIKHAEIQQSFGNNVKILDKDDCLKKEPTLVRLYDENKLAGGLFYPDDAAGNSLLFIKSLEKICQEKYGVVFEYDAEIKNIFTNHIKITGVHTSKGVYTADKYIYALGAYGNKILHGVGVDPKILPLKGYSLSIEANNEFIAPSIGITDCEHKIVYSRIGDIFRAAGTVEICGLKNHKNKSHINFLSAKIKSTFSDFGNMNKAREWLGFRPFRTNSIPLIGEIKKYGNLYLNTGHGHLGWTMSCGSAKLLAALIEGHNFEEFKFLEEEIETTKM